MGFLLNCEHCEVAQAVGAAGENAYDPDVIDHEPEPGGGPVLALASLAEIRSFHRLGVPTSRLRPGSRLRWSSSAWRPCGLFDWLARYGVLEVNPAAPVRGPAYSQARGKTPILTAPEAKQLIESMRPTPWSACPTGS